MSKRRINKQQAKRIANQHQAYQQESQNSAILENGLVISRFGSHAEVETSSGHTIHCAIRPSIDSLVAGDRVIWQTENETQGVVLSREDRHNVLSRPAYGGKIKAIAANITQAIIVIAPKPAVSWPLLDSYLIMTKSMQMKTVILFNKTDLPSEEIQARLIKDYQPLGYPLLFSGRGAEREAQQKALETVLENEVSVFVGQSGVGKSSLIHQLLPHEDIATQTISESSDHGKHTTSNSRYYHLPSGGALIDSPGVREFSLMTFDHQSILKAYPEFDPFIQHCKFRNCNHRDSLGCALIEAVKTGKVSETRYENYLKLCQQYLAAT